MVVIERSVHIDAAPPEVTGVLLDAELAPRWTAGLERLELVTGEPGVAGCVGRAHYREGRRRHVLKDELLEAVPGRYYRSRVSGGGIIADVETRLEPTGAAGNATRLTLRWSGMGTNPVTRLTLPLLRGRIVARTDADLEALRGLVEGQTTR